MTGFVFIYFISLFIDLFIKWFAFREPELGRFSIIAGPQYEDLYTSACFASFCHRCTNRLRAQLPSLFIYQNPHKLSGPWRMNKSYGSMRKLLQCLSFGNGIEAFENKGLLYDFLPLSLSLSLSLSIPASFFGEMGDLFYRCLCPTPGWIVQCRVLSLADVWPCWCGLTEPRW